MRVLLNVCQGLLNYTEQDQLFIGGEASWFTANIQGGPHLLEIGQALRKPLHGRDEAKIVKHGGPKVTAEVSEALYGVAHELPNIVQVFSNRGGLLCCTFQGINMEDSGRTVVTKQVRGGKGDGGLHNAGDTGRMTDVRLISGYEAMLKGPSDQCRAAIQPQLVHDATPIGVYCAGANIQEVCNLSRGLALRG